MRITIDYDGAIARCFITSVGMEKLHVFEMPRYTNTPFNGCDKMTQIIALNAFDTVTKSFERENKA